MTQKASLQRQPKFELLRILAILLISFMHGIKDAYLSPLELNNIAHMMVNAVGNMGVTCFVLLSGYFSIRFRPSKFIKLWSVILAYSVIIFAVDTALAHTPLASKAFVKGLITALTPITSNTWWFVSSYVIVFMLSPLLNKASASMSRRQFQYLLAVLLIFYSLAPTFLFHSMSNEPNGKCTQNMILAYLIGRYIALHGAPDWLQRHAGKWFLGCSLLIFAIDYALHSPYHFAKDNDLLVIIGATSLFLTFCNTRMSLPHMGNAVCKAATYTFPFYLLNWWLISLLDFQYVAHTTDYLFLPLFLLVQAELVAITFIVESLLRPLLKRPVKMLGDFADRKLHPLLSEIY